MHQFENGPPVVAPIEIRVIGPDIETLRMLAGEVEKLIAGVPGTRDVINAVRLQRTDLDLRIDTEKAALFGVPAVEADRTVRLAVAGCPPASSASRTATSTTSRCGCRSRAGRRSTC